MAVIMEEIIKTLMQRDNISRGEALNLIAQCKSDINLILSDNGTFDDVCQCIEDWLGLEPDYLMDFLPL